jgi:hypothetical protein
LIPVVNCYTIGSQTLEGLVDGQNRLVEDKMVQEVYAPAFDAYKSHARRLVVNQQVSKPRAKVEWLLKALE